MQKYIKSVSILTIITVLGLGVSLRPASVDATVPNITDIISLNNSGDGQGGNGNSGGELISSDGQFVAFESVATNLVSGDTNGKKDVFVRDLANGQTTRESVSSSGVEANNESQVRAVSKTGRYVVFASYASNLIDGETNSNSASGNYDLYLRDRQNGQTVMLNKNSSGVKAYNITATGVSDDGRFVAAETNATNLVSQITYSFQSGAVVLDRVTGTWKFISLVSPGLNGNSHWNNVQMNCDGAFIVYRKDDGIYLSDRRSDFQTTNIASVANDYSYDPRISCDGRYVGFQTLSTNLVSGTTPTDSTYHLVRYDRIEGSYVYLDMDNSGSFLPRRTTYNLLNTLTLADNGGAAFTLMDTNYPYYTSAYIRNVNTNTTEIISRKASNNSTFTTMQSSTKLAMDMKGKYVVYVASDSSLIAANDTNGYNDVVRSQTGW